MFIRLLLHAVLWVYQFVKGDAEMQADYDEITKYGRIMGEDMQFYGIHSWGDLLLAADNREGMAEILKKGRERMVPRARRGELDPEDNIIFDGM